MENPAPDTRSMEQQSEGEIKWAFSATVRVLL